MKKNKMIRRIMAIVLTILMLPLSDICNSYTCIVQAAEPTINEGAASYEGASTEGSGSGEQNPASGEQDPASGNQDPAQGGDSLGADAAGGTRGADGENVPNELSGITLSAALDARGVAQLAWGRDSSVPEGTEYEIYKNEALLASVSGEEAVCYYSDADLQASSDYVYYVQLGEVKSNEVTVSTPQALVIENNKSYYLPEDMTVFSFVSEGAVYLQGHQLTVCRDVTLNGGCVFFYEGSMVCNGDLVKGGDAYINMSHEGDSLLVRGDLNFEQNWSDAFYRCHLEVCGDFIIQESDEVNNGFNFNEVILSGNQKQTLDVPSYIEANRLEIRNSSEDGVMISRPFFSAEMEVNGNRIGYENIDGHSGHKLTEDEVIEGDYYLISGVLDLDGHSLTVKGDFYQLSGTVDINGGSLIVEKDYKMQGDSAKSTNDLSVAGNGLLKMVNDNDHVLVKGSFLYFSCHQDQSENLAAGVLEVKGDVFLMPLDYFVMGPALQFVLSGEDAQRLNSAGATIENLSIQNTGEGAVYLGDDLKLSGVVSIDSENVAGKISISADTVFQGKPFKGDVTIDEWMTMTQDAYFGGDLTIKKSLTVQGKLEVAGTCYVEEDASLYLEEGSVIVHGDLIVYGNLTENYEKDSIIVHGRVLFSDNYIQLSDGTLEVKGDLTSYGHVYAGDSHRLILSGDQLQVLNVTTEDEFGIVTLQNQSEEGVVATAFFKKSSLERNQCKFSYVLGDDGLTLTEDLVKEGDFVLDDSFLRLDGHTLTIKGDFIHKAGMLIVDGGKLIVEGNYYVADANPGEDSYGTGLGRLVMDSEKDSVLVKGNFVFQSNATLEGDLCSGTLEVKGDFIATSGGWEGGFWASGAHKVILSGTKKQTISVYGEYYFQDLELNNTSEDGIVFENNITVKGNIQDKSKNTQGILRISDNTSGYYYGEVEIYRVDDFYGDLIVDGNCSAGGYYYNKLKIHGSLTVKGDFSGGPFDVEKGGTLTTEGNLGADYYSSKVCGEVIVKKDCTIGGFVFEEGGRVTIDGKLTTLSSGISMADVKDYLLVKGDLDFFSYDETSLKAGTIEVKGDFRSQGVFVATDDNRLLLSGDQKQLIETNSRDSFAIIELQNGSSEGVVATDYLIRKQLIQNNSKFSYLNQSTSEWVLEQDVTLQGDYAMQGRMVNLNGHALTIEGNLILDSGILVLNSGELTVKKNFYWQKDAAGTASSDGLLRMDKEKDHLKIEGDFIVNTTVDTEGFLSAGTLEVQGDMTVSANDLGKAFYATGSHELKLSGTKKQTVTFQKSTRDYDHVKDLTLANESTAGIEIVGDLFVEGLITQQGNVVKGAVGIGDDTEFASQTYHGDVAVLYYSTFEDEFVVDGDLSISASAYFQGKTTVTGNCNVTDGGYLNMSGGELLIGKDLVVSEEGYSSVNMNYQKDYVLVCGNAYFSPANTSSYSLSYGTLEVRGDLISTRGLFASNKHRILLSGTQKQIVQTAENASVAIIEITNQSEDGVEFKNNLKSTQLIAEKGHFKINGMGCVGAYVLDRDKVYSDDLVVMGGTLDLDGHVMTVKGNFIQNCAEINLNGGRLIVEGDLLQPSGNLTVSGGSLVVNGDYRIQDYQEGTEGYVYGTGSGSLTMTDPEDSVLVKGSLLIDTTVSSEEKLTAGSIELKKDMIITTSTKYAKGFQASSQHTLILSGDSLQTISEVGRSEEWYNPRVIIQNLVIDNQSEDGVLFTDMPRVNGEITDSKENHVNGSIFMTDTTSFRNNYFGGSISTFRIPDFEELEIGGDFHCGFIYISWDSKKHVGGKLTIHGNACFDSNNGGSGDDLPFDGEELVVMGNFELGCSANFKCQMQVGKDFILGTYGKFTFSSGNLTIGQDFLMDAAQDSRFHMSGTSGSRVLVKGNMTVDPGDASYSWFSSGRLEVQGDFIEKKALGMSDSFWLELTGDKKQTVQLLDDKTIGGLTLWNTSEEGIELSHSLTVNDGLMNNHGPLTGGEILGKYAIVLGEDEVWEGDQYLNRDLDLNGHTLRIKGNLYHLFGDLYLNGGTLIIEEDYVCPDTDMGHENLASSSYYIKNPYTDEDRLVVYGSMILNRKSSMGTFYSKTVELKGDLVQNGKLFQTTDDSKLILSGDHKQCVTAKVNNLVIIHLDDQNTSEEGIEFSGTVYVSGELRMNERPFTGYVTMSTKTILTDARYFGDIKLGGTIASDVEITGRTVIGGAVLKSNVVLNGNVTVQGTGLGVYNKLVVNGNVFVNDSSFSLMEGEMIVNGNLTAQRLQTTSCISMSHATDHLLVTGNVDYYTYAPKTLTLKAGTFEVQGNLTSKGGILATEDHVFLFSGDREQKVSITGGEYFANVELKNYSDEGVIFDNLTLKGDLITNGCNCRQGNQRGILGWTLYEDEVYEGDLIMAGATLDLNGHSLTVQGNLIQMSGKIVPNGGCLTVEGDYWLQNYAIEKGEYKGRLGTGVLKMQNSTDQVIVEGDFVVNTTEDMSGLLTAGTLTLKGDFSDQSQKGFQASQDHVLVFLGEKDQKWSKSLSGTVGNVRNCCQGTLYVNSSTVEVLGKLDAVRNQIGSAYFKYCLSVKSLSQVENGIWAGNLTLTDNDSLTQDMTLGSLTIGGIQFNLNGHDLNVKDLTIDGVCRVGKGKIRCEEGMTVNHYLIMQNEEDYVFVGGDFKIVSSASHKGYLTNGTMELQGNFLQAGYDNFIATGNHKVILSRRLTVNDSDRIQTVTFNRNPGTTKFHTLILKKGELFYSFNVDPDLIADEVIYDIEDADAPTAVKTLTFDTPGVTSVTLRYGGAWDESGILGYEIYRNGVKVGVTNETSYLDTGLIPATGYEYTVYPFDVYRNLCKESPVAQVVTPEDEQGPSKPTVLRKDAGTGSSITLRWNASTDNVTVTGYDVYRNGAKVGKDLTETVFTDTGLELNKAYRYAVVAYDQAGNASESSDIFETTVTKPEIVEVIPGNYAVIGGDAAEISVIYKKDGNAKGNRIKIEWKPVLQEGEDTESWTLLTPELLPQENYGGRLRSVYELDLSGITGAQDYKLRFTLYDAEENTAEREITYHVDKQAAELPENIKAITNNGVVSLQFDASVSADCAGYNLYRRGGAGQKLELIAQLKDRFTTLYADAGVTPKETYWYALGTVDRYGNESGLSDEISVTVDEDKEAPVVKEITPAEKRIGGKTTLEIRATDNRDVAKVRVKYRQENSDQWIQIGEAAAVKGLAKIAWNTTLLKDEVYVVSAVAVDSNGNESRESFVKRYETDNTGIAKIEVTDVTTTATAVQLRWKDVTEADFAYFRVEQLVGSDFTSIGTVSDKLGFAKTNLKPDTSYTFRVVGYDNLGNRGECSDLVECTTKEDTTNPTIEAVYPTSSLYRDKIMLRLSAKDNYALGKATFSVSTDGRKTFTKLADVNAPTGAKNHTYEYAYEVSKLRDGEIWIRFEVLDAAGNKNALLSDGKEVELKYVIDHVAPAKVQSVKVVSKLGYVGLQWDEMEETDIKAYRIYRADALTGVYSVLENACTTKNYYDTKVAVNGSYVYKVAAVDIAGNEGECSDEVYATVARDEEKPSISGMSPASGSIQGRKFTLKALAIDNAKLGSVIFEYRKESESTSQWKMIREILTSDKAYLATYEWDTSGLEEGSYVIRAQARDAAGNVSDTMEATYQLDHTPPAAASVSAQTGNYKITLTIDAPQCDDFYYFEVQRREVGNRNFMSLDKGIDREYVDWTADPSKVYFYRVGSYDLYGNVSWSEEAEGHALAEDDIPPVAVVPEQLVGLVGMELAFDGIGSTDNVRVAEYLWDMGDGHTRNGAQPTYTYQSAGTYTVTLQVKDTSGNVGTASTQVQIYDRVGKGTTKVQIVDEDGKPIPFAMIYADLGKDGELSLQADSNGSITIAASVGAYNVAAYATNYLPKDVDIIVSEYETREYSLTLIKDELIKGELTVRRMTMEEMIEAGVDFSDPENFHRFTFELTMVFREEPIPVTVIYEYVPSEPGKPLGGMHFKEKPKGEHSGSGKPSGTFTVQAFGSGGGVGGYAPEPIIVYMKTSETIEWLKEMYKVELGILNNADSQYVIEKCWATLHLPNGLSLAKTTGGQTLSHSMGSIQGQERKSTSWVVRGDKSGSYKLTADFEGVLMPFETKVSATFETEEEFNVQTGEGISISVMPETSAYIGQQYLVQYCITNGSDRPKYNFTTSIPGYQEADHVLLIKNMDTGETSEEIEPAVYVSRPSHLTQSMVTRNGTTIKFEALMPGDSYYGTAVLGVPMSDNEDVYYKLVDAYAKAIEGSNLGVTVTVNPMGGHVSTFYYCTVVEDYSWLYADPIDISSGFFTDEMTAFSLQGGSALELQMKYSSGATDRQGELGYGWYHGYETWLEQRNGVVYYHMTPSMEASFIHDDMHNDIIYGKVQNGTVVFDEGEIYTYGKYIPLSRYLQDVSLVRNTDGTYTLVNQNGAILTYDADGLLIKVDSGDGMTNTITREEGRMIVTDDASGKKIYLNYDADHKLTFVSDDYGRKTVFEYDGDKLTGVTGPTGSKITYSYDENNHILTESNQEGVFVTNEYDVDGKVLKQKDAFGSVITMGYEALEDGGRVVTMTNAAGNSQLAEVNANGLVTKLTDENGGVTEYTYNAKDQVTSVKDSYGNCNFYRYDARGNLVETIDEANNKNFMTYDEKDRILTIEDANGNIASYTYDAAGNPYSYKDFNGLEKIYQYNQYGQLTEETQKGVGTVKYTYEKGMLTSVMDHLGGLTSMEYDVYGNLVKVKDVLGNTVQYGYDAVGRKISERDALGNVTKYAYDQNGNLCSETDALGHVTSYEYDRAGRRTKVIYADGSQIENEYDVVGNIVATKLQDGTKSLYRYDKKGNLIQETLPDGISYFYEYDLNGRRIAETDKDGRRISYEYYPNGKLYKTTYPDNTYELYTYNKNWEVAEYTNTAGVTKTYQYDPMGRKTLERDALGNEYHYEYDKLGNLTGVTDPNGNRTKYAYDANGNCTSSTDALGHVITMEYDPLGHLTSMSQKDAKGKEHLVSYEYDVLGRVIKVTDELGNSVETEYDALGNMISVTDALGNKQCVNEYDSMGRVTKTVDVLGTVTDYSYDVTGKILETVNYLNEQDQRKTKYEYDVVGRLTKVVDPLEGVTKRSYDERGRIASITDANGGVTTYEYDSVGRLLLETNPIGAKYSYSYQADTGLLKELENARGQKTEYTYDVLGRVTDVTDELGTVHYSYDKNGNVLTVSDKNGSIQRTYDELNRVTTYTDYNGKTIRYGYDELGNVISLTYPGGEIVRYEYYLNGLLSTVTDPDGKVTRYEYDANGNLTRTIRPNGTEEYNVYNAAGRLTEHKEVQGLAGEQTELVHYYYTYDEFGNVTSVEGMNTTQTAEGLNRLSSVSMTYDEANRLVTYNGEAVRYDADGNMTYGPVNGVMSELTYDCRNRLVSAGGVTYAYDPSNTRISAETDEYLEIYLTDLVTGSMSRVLTAQRYEKKDGKAAEESDVTIYVYGQGLISEKDLESGRILYHHYNNQGSTVALTDENGLKVAEYTYGAYGELLSGDASLTRYLYNGRCGVSTEANGLYYMRQRYYNVEIKRFINQDILTGDLANSQSLNRYSYVQGNPISYTDPFGLCPWAGLFTESNVYHALLEVASWIPGVGTFASAVDAYLYYKEGNKEMAKSKAVDALFGLAGGVGSVLQWGKKTKKVGQFIHGVKAVKEGYEGLKGFAENATKFGKAAVDYKMRHEGTACSSDKKLSKEDVRDLVRMGMAIRGMYKNLKSTGEAMDTLGEIGDEWFPTHFGTKIIADNTREMNVLGDKKMWATDKSYAGDNEVESADAYSDWDRYLGISPTDINPWTGQKDPDRLFSADGKRSILFGSAQMDTDTYVRESWNKTGEMVLSFKVQMK